jgi:hypothetical protein
VDKWVVFRVNQPHWQWGLAIYAGQKRMRFIQCEIKI